MSVPHRFNIARYCLEARIFRPRDKVALSVVRDADAPAHEAERWTYGDLREAVRAIAGGLRAEGFRPGERIMIRMENTSDYPLLYFAVMAAGLVAVPTSAQLTAAEARFILEDAECAGIAFDGHLALPGLPPHVRALDTGAIARLKAHRPIADFADTGADDPAFLVYTSGTSGRPKGVLHAHRSAWGRRPMYQGWYAIRPWDVILHAGAFNWTYTLGVGLTDPWANGASTVIYNGPKDPGVWLKLIEAFRATQFAAVPSLYRRILKYGDPSVHGLRSLRHGLTAGEALNPDLASAWEQKTGTLLYEALGMSECSTYISSAPGVPPKPGSPGKPQAGRQVAILPLEDETGTTPLPAGKTGLLAVHRCDPGLMLGYWNRPEEEEQVWRGDWFIGGDLARLDEDGYVWFEGRRDDLMNASGYRVSPEEVEQTLTRHPGVAEAAVTEIEVKPGVRVIAAFIVAADPAAPPDTDGILAFAREHLAAYKAPREVVIVEALPRTANGKVLRRALKDLRAPS